MLSEELQEADQEYFQKSIFVVEHDDRLRKAISVKLFYIVALLQQHKINMGGPLKKIQLHTSIHLISAIESTESI